MTAERADNVLPIHPKPTASFVHVTPETAARWLGRNDRNRNLRGADVDRYKRDMLSGNWHMDGAPVRFSPEGALLDGQHRLTAIVESGVTLPLLVVRGIDNAAQNVMDTGRRRTAADALAINGFPSSTLAAAAARIIIQVERGKINSGGEFEVTHSEVLACLDENPDLLSAIEFTKPLARRTDCPPAVVGYTYMVLRRINSQAAAEFWVGMADKIGLREGDPVIALSNRFAEARRNRERLNRAVCLSLVYRAWNTRRDGKSMRFIRVNSPKGGLVPIPTPH